MEDIFSSVSKILLTKLLTAHFDTKQKALRCTSEGFKFARPAGFEPANLHRERVGKNL